MPLSTRELYLVLRARDEASRTLRGISREMMATGAAAAAAAHRANAALAREEAQRLRHQAILTRQKAAVLAMNGATQSQINALRQSAFQLDNQARAADQAARAHDRLARETFDAARQQAHFVNTLHQTGVGLQTLGVGMVAAGGLLATGLYDAIKTSIEYERQVRHTATQVDGFKGNLQELGDIGRRVARDIAIPFEQIQPALFDIFSSTEANVKEAEILLRAFAKAAVAGQVDIQSASRATIGIMNAFQIPLKDVNRVLDMQFQLIQEGVGTYEEWATKIGNVSPSAARAGQSIELMMAALASATRMGLNAARATTAVARAFDALSNPKTAAKLKELGINVTDATGKFRPFNEVLRDFRTHLMKLPEKDRVAAILDVFKGAGSTIEARKFLQTMLLMPGTLEQFDNILKEVTNSAGSLDNAYSLMADSAAAKSELLRNAWMLLKDSLGTALMPAFIAIVTWITNLVNKFNDLSPQTKKAIGLLLGFTAALLVVSGIVVTVIGGIAAFIAAIAAAGTTLAIVLAVAAGAAAVIGLVGAAFYAAYTQSAGFREFLKAIWEDLQAVGKIFSDVGRGISDAWNEHIAPPLQKMGQYIEEWVLPAFRSFYDEIGAAVIPKLVEAGRIIVDIVGFAFKYIGQIITNMVIPAIQVMTEWWNRNKQHIEPLLPILGQVAKWLAIVAAVVIGVLVAALAGPLMAIIAVVIGGIFGFISMITMWIAAIKAVVNWFIQLGGTIRQWSTEALARGRDVGNWFQNLPNMIRSMVGNLGGILVQAGRDLIQGLIDGIQSRIPSLRGVIAGAASIISNFLPGSPVKEGPLKVLNNGYAGGQITQMIADGMASKMGLVTRAFQTLDMARAMAMDNINGGTPGGVGFGRQMVPQPVTQQVTKYITVNQTVHTQEIDPRIQAEQLGWEFAGVV
jgi:TP901 family phage tail tape measure protein